MNPIETRLVQAVQAFAARQAHFLSDHDTEAFAPAILAFRDEVDIAAREGVERWQAWHLVSAWITDSRDRIYCLQRVLATLQAGPPSPAAPERLRIISQHNFLRAQCLVQMAEIHEREGSRDSARECYERALPFARASSESNRDTAAAGSRPDSMEEKIAAALLRLNG